MRRATAITKRLYMPAGSSARRLRLVVAKQESSRLKRILGGKGWYKRSVRYRQRQGDEVPKAFERSIPWNGSGGLWS